jgi:hypothetical protein
MLTYHIVIESDGVARYVLRHDTLAGKIGVAPGVTLLSQAYIAAYKAQYGLADIPAVLAHMGFVNGLSAEDLNGL